MLEKSAIITALKNVRGGYYSIFNEMKEDELNDTLKPYIDRLLNSYVGIHLFDNQSSFLELRYYPEQYVYEVLPEIPNNKKHFTLPKDIFNYRLKLNHNGLNIHIKGLGSEREYVYTLTSNTLSFLITDIEKLGTTCKDTKYIDLYRSCCSIKKYLMFKFKIESKFINDLERLAIENVVRYTMGKSSSNKTAKLTLQSKTTVEYIGNDILEFDFGNGIVRKCDLYCRYELLGSDYQNPTNRMVVYDVDKSNLISINPRYTVMTKFLKELHRLYLMYLENKENK